MPRVFIIPHYESEALFPEIASQSNSAQADFKLHVLPPDNDPSSPLNAGQADFRQVLPYLEDKKLHLQANTDDLVIAFFDGVLTAREVGLSNLFMAGARYDEPNPCTAVVSLRFISWGVLEKKFDYDLQRHALLHLILCALLGAYTHVEAHSSCVPVVGYSNRGDVNSGSIFAIGLSTQSTMPGLKRPDMARLE